MIVNSETGSIDFFGIDQQYRNLDIAKAFLEKIVIVRECSTLKRILKFIMKDSDDEYSCVFTNKVYWFKRENIEPLAVFLDIEQMNPSISKQELRKFYKDKEEEVKKVLTKKPKREIGFNFN